MPSGSADLRTRFLLPFVLGWTVVDSAMADLSSSGAVVVSPSVVYTDNVCLSNNNQQADWVAVATASPSGSIRAKGSKGSFNMNGSVQLNTLTDSQLKDHDCSGPFGDREQFTPHLNASGQAKLIDKWLTLNGSAAAGQNQVNPGFAGGNDSLNRTGNTNTYYRYSVSPVVSRRVKNVAKYNLRYSYDEVINTTDEVSDSNSNALAFNLSNLKSSQISWDWLANYRRVEYSDDDLVNTITGQVVPRKDTELKNASLQLGYQINRRWQVNGRYGWEWNDFQTYRNVNDTGGAAWDMGVRWTPSPRTTVSVGSGDRFFGQTPRVNISHVHKRNTFTASYNKTITFANDIRTQQDLLNPDFINNAVLNSSSPILDERLSLGWSYGGRYVTAGLSGSHSQQTEADTGEKSTFQGLALSVSPLISRIYQLTGTVAWNDYDPESIVGIPNSQFFGEESEAWVAAVDVGRVISNRMSVSVGYQFTIQDSSDPINEYQENRVMATLNITL